ncbi:MAG: hypothetical protein B0D96_12220 [Candidatus Sedimenticola endophacoides]|nr:MAG: hypothetical protein B0D94_01200 [Candidatus Sedimenticola endophacoides]OQX33111.1 MAG: hypothetical protein B0D96_12220 [Candidatus Sedimenticola endophacoides]OQX38515.1 MAG: hypothetical protein B0D89_12600 [Candidatus Sedimenticola endophacoides]
MQVLEAEIEEIRFFHEPVPGSALDNALFHIRSILLRSEEMQSMRSDYMAVETPLLLERLYQSLVRYNTAQTLAAERYSRLLMVVAVVLFVTLGLALTRLNRARAAIGRSWDQLRDGVESLTEAFALFGADGRLVLCNSRYRQLYPWLEGVLEPGVTINEVMEANRRSGRLLDTSSGDGDTVDEAASSSFAQTRNFYIEQLSDGRWYLASDSFTSAGELVSVRIDITESRRGEVELRKLSRALEQSPASVVITDVQGRIEYVNPKCQEMSGYSEAELLGRNPRLFKSGDKSPREYAELWATISAGREWRGQFHNRRKDGSIYWESASISPVRDPQGGITHFIAVKEDITARKRSEEQLRMYGTVFETITEGIMVTDADNRIKIVNPAFTRITGYQPEEVVGENPRMLSSGRHSPAFYAELWESLLERGSWSGEIWDRRRDGTLYPAWLSLVAIFDERRRLLEYVAVFSDITHRKESEEQIRRQANYDALTGLPNRSLLRDRLSGALKSARRERWKVALLFVDLDRFKEVNDSLGHVAGDELLQRIGERLRGCVREADTVARFGGDEFVLLLEDIKQVSDAADVCKKILRELDGPVALHGRDVFVGASIGVTLYPDDAADANTMLRNADMAMCRAKDAGRNNYQFFTLAMNEQVQHRIELERDLRQALEQGQLLLHYQPIVRLDDLRVVGVEALLRWRHPERGLVLPDTFITLAEESGLIAPIGRWVLRMACRQAGSWRAAGLALKVSVNLSSHQLAMGLEVGEIQQILGEEGLDPEGLNIEITESTMMEDSEANLEWLEQAKAVGVRLAIDDFGTGYSSLSYLKRFPMDTLKIDRTFIRDVEEHPEDISLIEAIIAMAGSLGLQVVAEGIENPAQLELMRRHGCDLGQGNLFSEALEPGRIPDLVRVGVAAAE